MLFVGVGLRGLVVAFGDSVAGWAGFPAVVVAGGAGFYGFDGGGVFGVGVVLEPDAGLCAFAAWGCVFVCQVCVLSAFGVLACCPVEGGSGGLRGLVVVCVVVVSGGFDGCVSGCVLVAVFSGRAPARQ